MGFWHLKRVNHEHLREYSCVCEPLEDTSFWERCRGFAQVFQEHISRADDT